MDLMVEASPRRVFANAHTYHINSISVNSDNETYLSADDLRINLWHLEITDRSFSTFLVASEIWTSGVEKCSQACSSLSLLTDQHLFTKLSLEVIEGFLLVQVK